MYRYTLAMVAIVKDEAPGIFEWLAHHAALGFEAFFLYDNGSTDRTREEIAALPGRAHVEVIDWPVHHGQNLAYNDAVARFGSHCRWMAFFDADEFLNPMTDEPVKTILKSFEDKPGLAVPWATFGSAGHDRRPPGGVLENYLRRAPDEADVNRHIKCIVDPRRVIGAMTPHLFDVKRGDPDLIVLEDGSPVARATLGLLAQHFAPRRLRLNHYVVKSKEDFELKRRRGLAVETQERNEAFFKAHDRNEMADDTALRFLPAIDAARARRRTPRRGLRRLWPF